MSIQPQVKVLTPAAPEPDTPVLPLDRLRENGLPDSLPTYGDDRWMLGLLDHSEVGNAMTVNWESFPLRHRAEFRQACWFMINVRVDPAIAGSHGLQLVEDPAATTMYAAFTYWRGFARWLDENRPLLRLAQLTERDYAAYATHLRETVRVSDTRVARLTAVSRLYAHTWPLAEGERPSRPPWLTGRAMKRYAGPKTSRGENSTPPISKRSLQPLIAAAVRLVNNFDPATYLSPSDLTNREMQAISGACAVLTAYLTGMRPKEVCSLPEDCLREVEGEDGSIRHEVHGLAFKNQRDEDGRHASAGVERPEPWLTIEQGARAIRVQQHLSRVLNSTMLFAPSEQSSKTRRIAGLDTSHVNRRIDIFISHVNTTLVDQGFAPIPIDDAGKITLRRFRRTLAWFIANEPGGEVALGVQYGHLRIVTGQGYAGRSEAGLEDLIEMDEVLALVGLLDRLSDERDAGGTFSGPASARLSAAVDAFDHEFKGTKMTDKELARQIRSRPGLQVFDNPKAMSLCVWRPETAACATPDDPESAKTPVLTRCRLDCANHARTGQHLVQVAAERDSLRNEAALSPEPVALRLISKADRLDRDLQSGTAMGDHA